MRTAYPAHLILFDLLAVINVVKSTIYEIPHYVIVSIFLLLPPHDLSVGCSQTPSVSVFPLGRDTNFTESLRWTK
jgi:hypothetical protein